MANPYEVEHNIKSSSKTRTRRPSMSSFFNQLSQIETTTLSTTHNNIHSTPTPVDVAAAEQLLQEQFRALLTSSGADSSEDTHSEFLTTLISDLEDLIAEPPKKVDGVPQAFLDTLDRVDKKTLKESDTCPICNEPFLDDPFPLVVQLPCHRTHRFDLECVGPWLRLQGTCPLDRKRMIKEPVVEKKKSPVEEKNADEDEDDYDGMFA